MDKTSWIYSILATYSYSLLEQILYVQLKSVWRSFSKWHRRFKGSSANSRSTQFKYTQIFWIKVRFDKLSGSNKTCGLFWIMLYGKWIMWQVIPNKYIFLFFNSIFQYFFYISSLLMRENFSTLEQQCIEKRILLE